MKCPHCIVEFFPAWAYHMLLYDVKSKEKGETAQWKVKTAICPACNQMCAYMGIGVNARHDHMFSSGRLIHPKGASRTPLSTDVPSEYSDDYREAVLVVEDSAKASAALSRRALQHLIREKAGITRKDLAQEIQALIDSKGLPSHLVDAIDGVRNIGNFAAHPIKSTSTGEIVDVEPGEAEWLLDTLEEMFDFYFVAPASLQRKKDALNRKLADAGKPPMK